MPRYRGWRTSDKDVKEFNDLLLDANTAISEAIESMEKSFAENNLTQTQSFYDSAMPEVRDFHVSTPEQLHDEFLTRDDFNRYKRYLGRIVRASKAKPRKGTQSLTSEEDANQLTSFYLDENGFVEESAFMRSEQRLNISNRNRAAVETLQQRGIDMVQKNVVMKNPETGEFEPVTDEWRHPVRVWVPSTPNNQEEYLAEIEKDPSLAIIKPDEAVGGVIDWFGDLVPVTQEKKHRMSPKALAEAQEVDARTANRTDLYFSNYEAIVITTLPTALADEISDYIDAVQELPPPQKQAVYEALNESDDAGSIEYLYLDKSGTMIQKVNNILTFWRREIPKWKKEKGIELNVEVPKGNPKQSFVKQQLRDSGYTLNSGQNVYDEYQIRREEGTAMYATLESMSGLFGIVNAPQKKRRKRGKK